jgi:hypothetical protein
MPGVRLEDGVEQHLPPLRGRHIKEIDQSVTWLHSMLGISV